MLILSPKTSSTMHKIVSCGIVLLKEVIGSPHNQTGVQKWCQSVTCQCEFIVLIKESA